MSNLLIFTLIVIFGLVPFGVGVVYTLYKKTIIFPVALMVFFSSMLCAIVAFAVSEYGFNSLYWAIPTCLALLVSTNAVFKKLIQRPIKSLNNSIKLMSKGIINSNIDEKILLKKNELGELATSLKTTLTGLHNTADFANTIAAGDLNVSYDLLSADDEIGNSLLNMKKHLFDAEELERQRKIEEDNNNYITNGIARFSDILRLNTNDIAKLSHSLLLELVKYVGANQAGLFVLTDEENEEPCYRLVNAIAYDRIKKLEISFKLGEGLIGQCAHEKKPIYMTHVPDNYVNITSGLGSANPRSILIMPAIENDKVHAIIELASFKEFAKHEISLIEKISENIATTISNVRTNQRTLSLLEESKKNTEEMAAQEEELRQNIEELQATQEEMGRKNQLIEELSAKIEQYEKQLITEPIQE